MQEQQGQMRALTDLGNAERFVARHGENVRYVRERGWLVWYGKRWLDDARGTVQEWAKEAIRSIEEEVAKCGSQYEADAVKRHARQSQSVSLSGSDTEPRFHISRDQDDGQRVGW